MRRTFGLLIALAGCGEFAPAREPLDRNLVITQRTTGWVPQDAVRFSHPMDTHHRCIQAARLWLPSAVGPAPPPDAPPSHVLGYVVEFGPDVAPGTAWTADGPQTRFTLQVEPLPGQQLTTGPVRLGRAFRMTVSAGGAVWERSLDDDALASEGFVVVDPDGLGGRFRLTRLERLLPHGRPPPEEAIAVAGRWRCPAP